MVEAVVCPELAAHAQKRALKKAGSGCWIQPVLASLGLSLRVLGFSAAWLIEALSRSVRLKSVLSRQKTISAHKAFRGLVGTSFWPVPFAGTGRLHLTFQALVEP